MSTVTKNTDAKCIDHLEEDDPLPRQNWVCLSFVSPEGIKGCTMRALKIRGVYDTRKEADKRAKQLQQLDPNFNVFVGEVGKWLPWDPDPNNEKLVKDQHFVEEELQNLMKGYKENLEKTKKMEAQRKSDMIDAAAYDERTRKDKIQDRLRRKLEQKKQVQLTNDNQIDNNQQVEQYNKSPEISKSKKRRDKKKLKTQKDIKLSQEEKEIEELEKIAKIEKSKLDLTEQEINVNKNKLATVDEQLKEIQKLYAEYNEKQKNIN